MSLERALQPPLFVVEAGAGEGVYSLLEQVDRPFVEVEKNKQEALLLLVGVVVEECKPLLWIVGNLVAVDKLAVAGTAQQEVVVEVYVRVLAAGLQVEEGRAFVPVLDPSHMPAPWPEGGQQEQLVLIVFS